MEGLVHVRRGVLSPADEQQKGGSVFQAKEARPGTVAHVSDPSTLGGQGERIIEPSR